MDKTKAGDAVRKIFLKTDSTGLFIFFSPGEREAGVFRVRLEIDTNPPAGSETEQRFLDFPLPHAAVEQSLTSGFALKCHALLSRQHIKGRDWFDFSWYVSRRIFPNLTLLLNALIQAGPWAGQSIDITGDWLIETLENRIRGIDWNLAGKDVLPFPRQYDRPSMNVWGIDYFLNRLEELSKSLH